MIYPARKCWIFPVRFFVGLPEGTMYVNGEIHGKPWKKPWHAMEKNTWKQIEIEHDGDLNITQMGIYIWELPCKLT